MPRILDCRDPAERATHLETALTALRRGRVVVTPGESGYLLVCDAFSETGVNRVRDLKGRSGAPLGVLVGSVTTVDGVAAGIPRCARDLMQATWPGTLTLVLRQQPSLAWPLTARRVALRMPLHPIALRLAGGLGPTAVTTAGPAGTPAARSVPEIAAEFGDDVAVYLDAGELPVGRPSTVLDVSGMDPVLVREGDVPMDRLVRICPDLADPSADAPPASSVDAPSGASAGAPPASSTDAPTATSTGT